MKKNYWYVSGSHDKHGWYAPMCYGYGDDNTLYFGFVTTLFTTYARAKGAMKRTSRRSPNIFMEVRRGEVEAK